MRRITHYWWLALSLFVLALLCSGCPPAHVNPLDPESDHYIPPVDPVHPPAYNARVRSMHISRTIPNTDTYSVLCEIWSEGQSRIDTAWVNYLDWQAAGMRENLSSVWAVSLTSSYFQDPHLGSVIGQPFTFHFRGANDTVYSAGPVYLFRVIETTPVLISPRDGQTTSAFPALEWETFITSYPITFRVEVVLKEIGFEGIVWSRSGIAAAETRLIVTDSLADGNHYWTLFVEDPFGNISRSKEGYFEVQGEVIP